MSGGAARRLVRLEERARDTLAARFGPDDWPHEDQLEAVLDYLDFHVTFGTVAVCTDRELSLLSAVPEGLPEEVREHVERMDPKRQEERDRREYEGRRDFLPWRDCVRQVEEEHRAYAKESRQRDRELLERNRVSVGLPALTLEQIGAWGLEGTSWGEG